MNRKASSQEIVNLVTGVYEDNFRFLKEIDPGFPVTKAKFDLLDGKTYMKTARHGLSGVGALILLNQVAIASFACNLHYNLFPKLNGINFSIERAIEVMDRLIISRYENILFKKYILAEDHTDFTVNISYDKIINVSRKGLIFFKISFNICNGSFSGKMVTAYDSNKPLPKKHSTESGKIIHN